LEDAFGGDPGLGKDQKVVCVTNKGKASLLKFLIKVIQEDVRQ
jgi:hypothetical protein